MLAAQANSDVVAYDDALGTGWANWSWATVDLAKTSPKHAGARSIGVQAGAWEALYLHNDTPGSSGYTNLSFWINGGATGGQKLQVQATLGGVAQTAVSLAPLPTNAWQQVVLSMTKLAVADQPNFDGFWIQDRTGAAQPVFYVDDILLEAGASGPPVSNPAGMILVDAAANHHPISPLIYGLASATAAQLSDLNATVNRWGGNNTTRYNWQLNADNRAADWYFESLPYSSAVAGEGPDTFIATSQAGGAQAIITVPTIGWVARLGTNRGRLSSFSIKKYGAQKANDAEWFADAGNGISSATSKPVTGNDPADASVLVDSSFQQNWVQHLVTKWGRAGAGGVRYYLMDNEPSIWHSTHRDVHPAGAPMKEIRDRIIDYASHIKQVDPAALIVGPEEWGWSGYLYSGADQQYGAAHGWGSLPDRSAHGNEDYLPWLLDQMHQYQQTNGVRLLDVFSVHYYPQGGEFGDDVSATMQLRRNVSTRSLWDPNYTDTSWINAKVQLIPRLKTWVAGHYPGTATAITEYNWGAEAHINGATAQADLLGIFGREGLEMATRWTTPATGSPVYNAIKLYRNYDGQKSSFGDTSVAANVANPDQVASFAATRSSDGALTIMVVSKYLSGTLPLSLRVTNYAAADPVEQWQLKAGTGITRLTDTALTNGLVNATLPSPSVTLFVLHAAQAPSLSARLLTAQQMELRLSGQPAQPYRIEMSANLVSWNPGPTNRSGADGVALWQIPIVDGAAFYRARSGP